MINLILSAVLSCPAPIILNRTDLPWTEWDIKTIKFSSGRCKVFYKTSKCMKRFEKIGFQNYKVTCGRPR